jgi:glycerophosphoryl diester phosphodiesterase
VRLLQKRIFTTVTREMISASVSTIGRIGSRDGLGHGLVFALAIALTALLGACADESSSPNAGASPPFVAAHRGDPHLPENTLAAFRSSLAEGADYLETDLVASKDGVLVLRHERRLAATTDVEDHPEFAARRTTKESYGRRVSDWWVEDFTLAELSSLRATVRRAAPGGDYRIATLEELIEFARAQSRVRGRPVGLYLETKEAKTFERLGLDLEDLLAQTLRAAGLDEPDGVLVQSWGTQSVRQLGAALRVPAVQLVSAARRWDRALTSPGLRQLRTAGVDGIDVVDDRLERDPDLVQRAHEAGLLVTGWGFEPDEDYSRWVESGLDGLVTGDVSAALAARKAS